MQEKPWVTSLEELFDFADKYTNSQKHLAKEKEAREGALGKELVLWTAIAGIDYYLDLESEEGKRIIGSLVPGTALALEREPDNTYDRWAIEIKTLEGIKLGYVTRYKNEAIARMMDYGHIFEARAEGRDDENTIEAQRKYAPTEQFILPYSIWLLE